jgi:very-short-patch-repair endonuclease
MCGKAFYWSPSRHKANNITYCSLACRDADPARHDALIAMNARQQGLSPNKVEQRGYALLDSLGVPYERQHVVGGKFCVDAFVPDAGLVIQFDGDYWHGNPKHFPAPDARQRKRMALDQSQDAYMRACGYRVLRVWASELETLPARAAALLAHDSSAPER